MWWKLAQLVKMNCRGSWCPTSLNGWFHWLVQDSDYHLYIKIVDSSVCYNTFTLLICGNMWFNPNMLKIYPKGVTTFKKVQPLTWHLLLHRVAAPPVIAHSYIGPFHSQEQPQPPQVCIVFTFFCKQYIFDVSNNNFYIFATWSI